MAAPAFGIMKFHSNTTWAVPFQIRLNGAALSLAGATIVAKLRKEVDDVAALASFSTSLVDAANGRGLCVLAAATNGAFTYEDSPSGEWINSYFFFDILITMADGTVLGPFRSKILARKAVSR